VKKSSIVLTIILILTFCFTGWTSCKKKPATKEEATKQVISNLLDSCKAGKNEDAVKQFNDFMPEEEKSRGRAIDASTSDGKQKAERLCREINQKYGSGYEFGKMETQGEAIGWNVFPKGSNEGQIWAFKPNGDKWILVDIDPAKR
jgi:hypothetical protein